MAERPTGRVLPDEVRRQLHDAFQHEVQERLPHLREGSDSELVLRDVHSLASSAWVVDEREVSRLARQVEDELHEGAAGSLPALIAALEEVTEGSAT